jgi:hypothetical protein
LTHGRLLSTSEERDEVIVGASALASITHSARDPFVAMMLERHVTSEACFLGF